MSKYQRNPMLEYGLPELLIAGGMTTGIGAGIGAASGHIASKFDDEDLNEEEKEERAKKLRRKGALIGGTIGAIPPAAVFTQGVIDYYKPIKKFHMPKVIRV